MGAVGDLVGIAEIAEMTGLTRQRVDQLSRTDPEFPKPVAELKAGRIWAQDEVKRWIELTGRGQR